MLYFTDERQNNRSEDQQQYDTGYSQGYRPQDYDSPGFGGFGFQGFGPRMGPSAYRRYPSGY